MLSREGEDGISLRAPESSQNRVLPKPDFDVIPQSSVKDRIKDFLGRARALPEHASDVSEPIVLDADGGELSGGCDESLGVIMDIIGIGPAEPPEES